VLSFKVLHHIGNWEQALQEIGRVLRPGGYYLLDDIALASEKTARFFRRFIKNYGIYTIEEVTSLLTGKRFEVLHEEKSKGIVVREQTMIFHKTG
jgi:ubiquinone/menaquinone biosynthesis C-methylase UbiE